MLFELKKLLTIPFLPLYFALLSGVVAIIFLYAKRNSHWGRWLALISTGTLLVFSNKAFATMLLGPLEHRYPAIPEIRSGTDLSPELSQCVAIVVLGGGHADAPALSRVNQLSSSALSRIAEAVRLSRVLPHATFIVSGHHTAEISHAQVLGEAAVSLGLDPARVVRMDNPRDTEDEIAELSRRLGTAPVALVTSAWHMPRAMELCRHFNVHAVPCPADYMVKLEPLSESGIFVWELEALERSTKAMHEYIGLAWLKLRGR